MFVRVKLIAVSILIGVTSASAQTTTGIVQDEIKIDICVVSSINDIEVSARVKGYLQEQPIQEGDDVAKDQLLSQLDPTPAEAELEVAKIRFQNAERQANDETGVLYAKATYDVAKQELEINRELNRKNALSNQELRRSELSARQADLQIQRSESQQKIDQGTVELERQNINVAELLINRHSVNAPFAGQVITIFRRPGEWVHEGEKILRLVDLSQVKVEGYVDFEQASPDEVLGRPVIVTLKLSRGQVATFSGEIRNIGLEQKPGGLFVVQAIVENEKRNGQWLLRPNAVVSMEIAAPVN